jgi:bifunctional DNA-binding transcriptional regulator/antitoxin component of YhaV-PrlF toxin-antitoxin module
MVQVPPSESVVLSTKGQIVIPRILREVAGLAAGVRLIMQIREEGIIEIRPCRQRIDETFGMLDLGKAKSRPRKRTSDNEHEKIMELVSEEDSATRSRKS